MLKLFSISYDVRCYHLSYILFVLLLFCGACDNQIVRCSILTAISYNAQQYKYPTRCTSWATLPFLFFWNKWIALWFLFFSVLVFVVFISRLLIECRLFNRKTEFQLFICYVCWELFCSTTNFSQLIAAFAFKFTRWVNNNLLFRLPVASVFLVLWSAAITYFIFFLFFELPSNNNS